MGPLGGFVLESVREDHCKDGAQALVIQRGPPAHGAGQIFNHAGGRSEAAWAIAGCDQTHGVAARPFAQVKRRKEGLALVHASRDHDGLTARPLSMS